MRTTLTLDDDVAALLTRLQRSKRRPFKELVNEALRQGLKQITGKPKARKPYQTRAVDLGRCPFRQSR